MTHDVSATPREDRASDAGFLRLLAHELRNYIAPVHNAMHLMRLKLRGDATLVPVIELIERQLVAMTVTLDAVSDLERVRRGEMSIERAPASLHDVVARAVQALPGNARRDRIETDVPDTLEPVELDAARMTRVIAGLLDNALRYAPGDSPVRLAAREMPSATEIVIDDAGPGMSAAERERALEFFELPHRPGRGLGLTLPLAAAMTRLHGGSLALEPSPQGGLRVLLRLPRAGSHGATHARSETAAEQDDIAAAATGTGRRVLLADDSAAVRTSLTDLLQEMGHEVRAVADGAEAVSMAQAWHPEFVLLDIHMPKLNGFDAARKLRALYPSSTMQLVMLSGEGLDDVMRAGAKQAGFDHCVDKGLAIGELTSLLAQPATTGQRPQKSL